MCESPQDRELRELLEEQMHKFSQHRESNTPSVAILDREKDLLSRERYHNMRNVIGMSIQMSKRMEALECIMEAYPSNLTLKEIKAQLESSILKNDKEVRELVKVK